jgi:outer membrane protein OmpA-like peptidoglycan-associated protein
VGAASAQPCDTAAAEAAFTAARAAVSTEEKLAALDRSIAACPSFRASFAKAQVLGEADQLEAALESLRESEVRAPDASAVALVRGYRGLLQKRRGERCDAWTALKDARSALGKEAPPWIDEALAELERETDSRTVPADEIACVLTGRSALADRSLGVESRSLNLRVHFALDSATVEPSGLRQIEELARALGDPGAAGKRVRVVGHTDTQGADAHNQTLSEQRAAAVRAALVASEGRLSDRIEASGRGEREPLANGESEDVHRMNRRVEVSLAP